MSYRHIGPGNTSTLALTVSGALQRTLNIIDHCPGGGNIVTSIVHPRGSLPGHGYFLIFKTSEQFIPQLHMSRDEILIVQTLQMHSLGFFLQFTLVTSLLKGESDTLRDLDTLFFTFSHRGITIIALLLNKNLIFFFCRNY